MKRAASRSFLAVCACIVAGIVAAQDVSVDFDKGVDFSKFKTYGWQPGQPAPSPLVDKRILNAIDGQLASKGWTKTMDAPSDAVVVYYAALKEQKQLNAWGAGPRWSGYGTVNVATIRIGQLVVDVYDASSKQLVWRGIASDTVSDKQEKNEKKLNDAVAKLFKQFPPARTTKTTD
jgi:hypothetical protein